jgi:DnaJ homolog subfamily C member 19
MIKLLWIALVVCLFAKLLTGRWPWQWEWRELLGGGARSGPGNANEVRRAQALLGVSGKASREQVIDAHRRLLTRVHPDRGGSDQLVHEANAARDLLLDQIKRD